VHRQLVRVITSYIGLRIGWIPHKFPLIESPGLEVKGLSTLFPPAEMKLTLMIQDEEERATEQRWVATWEAAQVDEADGAVYIDASVLLLVVSHHSTRIT
jgi:hypothetical protein